MKHLLLTTIAALLLAGCGNSEADHALTVAVSKGNIEAAKQAIDDGAFFDAKSDRVTWLLPYAAQEGYEEIVELLIANGADVNLMHRGGRNLTGILLFYFPLQGATANGHKEIVELLIAKGADVNMKGYRGFIPLHYAALNGRKDVFLKITELLIANGVEVNAKDDDGETPLDWAIKKKHAEIADLLRKHGGKTGEELEAAAK